MITDRLLNVSEAAAIKRCSVKAVRRAVHSGELTPVQPITQGVRTMFTEAEVARWAGLPWEPTVNASSMAG